MASPSLSRVPVEPEVFYPESDGKPMGETEWHIDVIFRLRETLQYHFRRRKVYVGADLFLYYEKGNPRACVAPDIMVIKGVKKHARRTFKTWIEKAVPCAIFEITSDSTIGVDLKRKYRRYAQLGVAEYFIFDPLREVLDPPLLGFRLQGGDYVELGPNADGSLICQELGLRLSVEDYLLRFTDLSTGEPLLTGAERAEAERKRAEQEQQRAEQERQRAEQEQQRAEQEWQRAEQEQQRAKQERQRAEQEQQRAEQERQRAETLVREVERLKAELARQKAKNS